MIEKVLIRQTFLELGGGHSRPRHLGLELVQRIGGERPLGLVVEQAVNQRFARIRPCAADEHKRACRKRIEQEFAQNEFYRAGVDVIDLERRPDVLLKGRAVAGGSLKRIR
jgi:hypothetical protein